MKEDMRMHNKKIILFFVVILILISCSSPIMQIKPTVSLPAETVTDTSYPVIISTFTPTPSYPTHIPTISLTITPTKTSEASLLYNCLEVIQSLPANLDMNGIIVLEQAMGSEQSILLNAKTGEESKLDNAYQIRVSPDGLQLAYIKTSGQLDDWQLIIMTNKGKQTIIPWEKDWDGIATWLDSERLMINRKRWSGQGPFLLDSAIVLNPTTGIRQELLPQYPNIYISPIPVVTWPNFRISRTIYDTALTKVVYPATAEDGTPIVLWDMISMSVLAIAQSDGYIYGSTPQWSPDNEVILIDLLPTFSGVPQPNPGNEMYIITRDGEINRLTNLTNTYKTNIHNYSWSHDGQYIAFWLKIEPSQFTDERLAILDLVSGKVTNYCIPGDPHDSAAPAPVWSLDGKQLVVESRDPNDENQRIVILVDINQGFATPLADNVTPVGWMVSP